MMISLLSLLVMQPAEEPTAADAAEKQEKICKRVREEAGRTGSNLRRAKKRKVCMTADEWAAIERSKDELLRTRDERSGSGSQQGAGFGG